MVVQRFENERCGLEKEREWVKETSRFNGEENVRQRFPSFWGDHKSTEGFFALAFWEFPRFHRYPRVHCPRGIDSNLNKYTYMHRLVYFTAQYECLTAMDRSGMASQTCIVTRIFWHIIKHTCRKNSVKPANSVYIRTSTKM